MTAFSRSGRGPFPASLRLKVPGLVQQCDITSARSVVAASPIMDRPAKAAALVNAAYRDGLQSSAMFCAHCESNLHREEFFMVTGAC